jgi:hypothetical protein
MAVGLVQADGMGQRFGEGAEAKNPDSGDPRRGESWLHLACLSPKANAMKGV